MIESLGPNTRRMGLVCLALAVTAAMGCKSSTSASPVEGSTGTRAKGEEGALAPNATPVASATTAPPEALQDPAVTAAAGPRARDATIDVGGKKIRIESAGEALGAGGPPPAARRAGAPPPFATATAAPTEKEAMPRADQPLRARLDPNARYATTYRPGGAMLAAFDAAVARGSLPAGYRELVADFGGRYAPAIESPKGQALAFRVETERASLAPAGGFLHLRVAMRSSDESPGRSPLSVHLVLDVSGSMSGAPIDHAKSAAKTLVEKLAPTDSVSITTFSDSADVIVPNGVIGPRRALVSARIDKIIANGGTNISEGLDRGYAEARKAETGTSATKIVMLLSDGMANAGDTNRESLAARGARALTDGIQTSTFGVGDSFDAALMANVADRGAGGYYYLKDAAQIAGALTTELDARLQPVAQAVEVRLRLKPDVAPVRVYGSRELGAAEASQVRAQEVAVDRNAAKKTGIAQDRQHDAEGGMRFFVPAFARADRHAMLVELELPPGVGERTLGSVEIRYKDLVRKKNVTEEIAVKAPYASSDAESAKTTNASVVATMQAFSAGDAILRASDLAGAGRRDEASRSLRERAELLNRASASLKEPGLSDDAKRLARLASIVSGESRIDPVPLAILLRGSGYGYLR